MLGPVTNHDQPGPLQGCGPGVTRSSSSQEKPEIWIFLIKVSAFVMLCRPPKVRCGVTGVQLLSRRVLEKQPPRLTCSPVFEAVPLSRVLQPSGTWSAAWAGGQRGVSVQREVWLKPH